MRRERVSDDIYIFTSGLYVQVTASVILTSEGAIVIDTLPFPSESRQVAAFVKRRSSRGARYVINTHFHADHVYGNYLFSEGHIVGHVTARDALLNLDPGQLLRAQEENPALEGVQIIAPTIVFENEMGLSLGDRQLRLIHLPGHSEDGIGVYADRDKILFSGDAVMPVPYFAQGDPEVLKQTLRRIIELAPENIVQGHGETLLRGEIEETLLRHIDYIDCAVQRATDVFNAGQMATALHEIEIEECGLSAIPLDGLVRQLHLANLYKVYNELRAGV